MTFDFILFLFHFILMKTRCFSTPSMWTVMKEEMHSLLTCQPVESAVHYNLFYVHHPIKSLQNVPEKDTMHFFEACKRLWSAAEAERVQAKVSNFDVNGLCCLQRGQKSNSHHLHTFTWPLVGVHTDMLWKVKKPWAGQWLENAEND